MSESALDCLRGLFNQARDGVSPFGCRWDTDNRHDAYVAVLKADQIKEYFGQLESVFDGGWEEENADKAPEPVKILIERLGGLRSGQYLFAQAVGDDLVGYVALWPWQNGVNVSVRVGVMALSESKADHGGALEILKESFG